MPSHPYSLPLDSPTLITGAFPSWTVRSQGEGSGNTPWKFPELHGSCFVLYIIGGQQDCVGLACCLHSPAQSCEQRPGWQEPAGRPSFSCTPTRIASELTSSRSWQSPGCSASELGVGGVGVTAFRLPLRLGCLGCMVLTWFIRSI